MEPFDSLKRTSTSLSTVSDQPKRTRHDQNADKSPKQLAPGDYRVGWVCALSIERTAAEAMLEEEHAPLAHQSERDTNAYTLGRIGLHNVVIAGLPNDHYGINTAITVANNMLHSFPLLDRRLMVGIAGAAPDLADIRLGDVVVSSQVIQYDFGKAVSGENLDITSIPTRPPQVLLNAVAKLRAMHNRLPSQIPKIIMNILERYPKMVDFRRPNSEDVLYEYSYKHVPSSTGMCCVCDEQSIVIRRDRPSNDPMIHYGKIASANQVMRNGAVRKRVTDELEVACFEMEAAGLMDDAIGCLVIRGMCDYSDTHKNKEWQKYAAMVGAAYASELLHVLPATASSDREDIHDENDPTTIPRVQRDKLSIRERRQQLLDALAFDEQDARHTNIKAALKKTCEWFLTDDFYLQWLAPVHYSDHHGFLWISGKPGSGKSTLMKFLFADAVKTSHRQPGTAVVSFFFNARGTAIEKSTQGLYRSLLFQIFTKLPNLQSLLDPHWDDDSLFTLETLQTLFQNTVRALQDRRLICFIDALDECDEEQILTMIELFEELGETAAASGTQFYICFSSRHYPHVEIQPCLRRTLEDHPGHMADIQKYVLAKLRLANRKDKASTEISSLILEKAGGVFMWVVLVIEILNKELRRGRATTIKKHLQSLPSDLTNLFREVILRDGAKNDSLLLCIRWILFAKRPLQVEEYYYAIHSGLDQGEDTLAARDPNFVTREYMHLFVTSSSKGLAEITRTKKAIVQFIHESVRDFLLKEDGLRDLFYAHEENFEAHSHEQLKKCCQFYLDVDASSHQPAVGQRRTVSERKSIQEMVEEQFPFLAYATTYLLYHADMAESHIPQGEFLDNFNLGQWLSCRRLFELHEIRDYSSEVNVVFLCAELGYARLLRRALRKATLPAACEQDQYARPQLGASPNGLVTRDGIDVNAKDNYGRTALSQSIEGGHTDVMKVLLEHDSIDLNCEPRSGGSILHWAIRTLQTLDTLRALLKPSLDLNLRDDDGLTALSVAILNGNLDAVALLISITGVDVDIPNTDGQTPLMIAALQGKDEVLKLLLSVDSIRVNSRSKSGRTALSYACERNHTNCISHLLATSGIDVDARDAKLWTPLSWAASRGHAEAVQQLLVVERIDVNNQDEDGRTPLFYAAEHDYDRCIGLLLNSGQADGNIKDKGGRTAMTRILLRGWMKTTK